MPDHCSTLPAENLLDDMLGQLAARAPTDRVRQWAARLHRGEYAAGTIVTSSPRPALPSEDDPALAVVAHGDEDNTAAGEEVMTR